MLLGQIEKDRMRVENHNVVVDDRGDLRIRIDLQEIGFVLVALENIDGDEIVGRR